MNIVVSHIDGVRETVAKKAEEIHGVADGLLMEARSTTHWVNIGDPASTGHRYEITKSHGDVDSFVNLEGPNPLAMEFGHSPSGYFAPERYGHITKSPEGLYILTRASGIA
jgi:hypothetical protein